MLNGSIRVRDHTVHNHVEMIIDAVPEMVKHQELVVADAMKQYELAMVDINDLENEVKRLENLPIRYAELKAMKLYDPRVDKCRIAQLKEKEQKFLGVCTNLPRNAITEVYFKRVETIQKQIDDIVALNTPQNQKLRDEMYKLHTEMEKNNLKQIYFLKHRISEMKKEKQLIDLELVYRNAKLRLHMYIAIPKYLQYFYDVDELGWDPYSSIEKLVNLCNEHARHSNNVAEWMVNHYFVEPENE
jgi:hypothetical protein